MSDDRPAKDRMLEYLGDRGLLGNDGALFNSKNYSKHIEAFIDPSCVWGAGTIIWHYAIVLADVTIGRECNIGGHAEIGRGTTIGDRTRISSGVFLPSNSKIGNDVFIGPNVTCTDDRFPRTLKPGEHYVAEPPTIEDHASIGAGAVLLPGIRIGKGARVAAGAIVTKDVPDGLAVRGLPAKRFELSTGAKDRFGVSA